MLTSQKDFGHQVGGILDIVIGDNFKISRRKTKYEGHQSVTGIDVFLNKIDAPNRILEKSAIELATNEEKRPYTNYVNNIRNTNVKK